MKHLPRSRATVLLTGDYQSPQFEAAVAWLKAAADVASFGSLADAAAHLRQLDADPLLIVVAQSYPGQYAADEIEQLHHRSPLSRFVALLGSWCEGEARSGRPWPGVIRIYWHQFESRVAQLLNDTTTSPPLAHLPRTSTVSEQLERISNPPLESPAAAIGRLVRPSQINPRRTSQGLLAIRARRHVDFDALAEALRPSGYATVWLCGAGWRDIRGAAAIIWDAAQSDWQHPDHLAEIRSLSETAPVIALMNFPRHEDQRLITATGAAAVVSRPFLESDLIYQIHRQTHVTVPQRVVA